jgi:universal protein Kae1
LLCLGIESTAHTFGIGIVDDNCNVLANVKCAHTTESGGLIPKELFSHHVENAKPTIQRALTEANVSIKDIDLISFSAGPGIGQALSVGATAARMLALHNKLPLLGVNHCVAHIEIGKKKTGCTDPIIVYASGANTQIAGYESKRYRIYGETLDTGIGNLLDSFGRELGLGFPAGPIIDRMYFEAKDYIELPYSVKGMDLAFSGLLTAAKAKITPNNHPEIAHSLMHTAFAMLSEVSERALAHTEKKELMLTGGVAASKALQKMLSEMCEDRGAKFFPCPASLAADNGAMIAWQGIVEHSAGRTQKISETDIDPKWRTDQVEVFWLD